MSITSFCLSYWVFVVHMVTFISPVGNQVSRNLLTSCYMNILATSYSVLKLKCMSATNAVSKQLYKYWRDVGKAC